MSDCYIFGSIFLNLVPYQLIESLGYQDRTSKTHVTLYLINKSMIHVVGTIGLYVIYNKKAKWVTFSVRQVMKCQEILGRPGMHILLPGWTEMLFGNSQ